VNFAIAFFRNPWKHINRGTAKEVLRGIKKPMTELTRKHDKARISVTLTRAYLDALDHLVYTGVYLGRGEAVLDALRRLFMLYEMEPFTPPGVEPE